MHGRVAITVCQGHLELVRRYDLVELASLPRPAGDLGIWAVGRVRETAGQCRPDGDRAGRLVHDIVECGPHHWIVCSFQADGAALEVAEVYGQVIGAGRQGDGRYDGAVGLNQAVAINRHIRTRIRRGDIVASQSTLSAGNTYHIVACRQAGEEVFSIRPGCRRGHLGIARTDGAAAIVIGPQIHRDPGNACLAGILDAVAVGVVPDIVADRAKGKAKVNRRVVLAVAQCHRSDDRVAGRCYAIAIHRRVCTGIRRGHAIAGQGAAGTGLGSRNDHHIVARGQPGEFVPAGCVCVRIVRRRRGGNHIAGAVVQLYGDTVETRLASVLDAIAVGIVPDVVADGAKERHTIGITGRIYTTSVVEKSPSVQVR